MAEFFKIFTCLILSFILPRITYSLENDYNDSEDYNTLSNRRDVCVPRQLGGVEWILSVKNSDNGWGEDTHRAIIALAINEWKDIPAREIRRMELQLDVEITKSLLRNHSSAVHPNDLALYIHTLISTNRNPRNFYGHDLVSHLLWIVESSRYEVHPFLLLALCNSKVANSWHLSHAQYILKNWLQQKSSIDYLALALKTYTCMKTMGFDVEEDLVKEASHTLLTYQSGDGSFGNVYTTSLVVQALVTSDLDLDWDKEAALDFLRSRSTVNPNMVSTYMIELALHCHDFLFLKYLHPDLDFEPVPEPNCDMHYIQYTLKEGIAADVYFTISIKVPKNATFFDVMQISAKHDSKFNFSYYLDKNSHPNVYSISGIPNDAEGNQYWRLCQQTDIDHNRHEYIMKTIHTSPALFIPKGDDHMIYWFRDSDCGGKL